MIKVWVVTCGSSGFIMAIFSSEEEANLFASKIESEDLTLDLYIDGYVVNPDWS